jgi:tetratricopeptide (TPR) repeat protein
VKHLPLSCRLACGLLAAATFSLPCAAADSSPFPADSPAEASADKLADARELIRKREWTAAINALKKVDDRSSADWNNLMGYTHRKAKPPDYAAAERYYDEALRIDPKHKGALEYSGQLYLLLNQLPKAEAQLARLAALCKRPCEEQEDLKTAIAAYRARASVKPLATEPQQR